MKKCGIYKITSPSNKIYIGQSRDINKRIQSYIKGYKLKAQPKLYNSINKYTWENHTFEIIEECEFNELNNRERYWQEYYNSIEQGLNCFYTKTEEKPLLFSKEMRNNMSKGQKGKISSIRKKVYQFNLQGNFIKDYISIKECAKILNINASGIGACCRGNIGKYKGFYFSFDNFFKKRKNLLIKTVVSIDLETNQRKEYESLSELIKDIGFKIDLYTHKKYSVSKCNKLFYLLENEQFVNNQLQNKKDKKSIKKEKIYKNKKKVMCIEDNLEFKSISEAGRYYNVYPSNIHNQIKGLSKTMKNGKTFKYI